MGVRVLENCNAISAELNNGVLSFDIGSNHIETKIDAIKNEVFKRQCNHFNYPEIFALLFNDVYGVILRRDGTGCVYLSRDKVLVKNFRYEVPKVTLSVVEKGGSALAAGEKAYTLIDLFTDKEGNFILSVPKEPISMVIKGSENEDYLVDLRSIMTLAHPVLKFDKKGVYGMDGLYKKKYKLVGDINIGDSFAVFVEGRRTYDKRS